MAGFQNRAQPFFESGSISVTTERRKLAQKSGSALDQEADRVLNEVLQNDECKDSQDESDSCPAACAEDDSDSGKAICECDKIAEHSSRLSLRVMEAMRWLQQDSDEPQPTCTVQDIVDHIEENYRDDGDLYAQVRTVLKQVCSQGFVLQLMKNGYRFIGPDATSMNQAADAKNRGDCEPENCPKRRKIDTVDSCGCGSSSTEEMAPGNKRRRFFIEDRPLRTTGDGDDLDVEDEEDIASGDGPQCTCSVNLTDENPSLERTTDSQDQEEAGPSMNSARAGTRFTQNVPDSLAEREANGYSDSVTDEDLLDTIDDVHQELQEQAPTRRSKEREKELERWIKRCQEECERRKRRN